jgi:chitinase
MQSFTLDLTKPVNATISRAFNRVSILDNDTTLATPALSVRNAIVDETAGTVSVPVLLGGTHGTRSNSTVTVSYATSNDNATAGSDYTAESGALTFAPGQSVQNIVVPITNDTTAEGAERFDITLSNPANSTIANGTGVVTIAANDSTPVATPTISVGPDAVVGETDGYIDLTVALNAPSTNPVSVHYSTVAGTASSFQNADFVGVAGILNYAPGETTKTVRVDITDGVNDVELMQSFTLDLTKPVNATISRAFNRVSILDNDTTLATPALSVRNAIVDETAGTVSVPVLLGGTHGARSNSTVTVSYATSNDNATAGSDYTAESGQLTFAPGQSVQNIVVPITNDTTAEGAERFDITLSNPANSTIANGTGVVTIAANDSTPVATPTVSTGAALVVGENDGYVDLTVSLNHPSTNPVSVHFTTVDGTASSFQYADFVGVAGILNFAPGETTKAVRIEITDNTTVEARESFHFRLSRPVNATFGTVSEKVAIRDND